MTSAVGGGSPKIRRKKQNQLICDSDKGEGVKKSDNFADVICGSPLWPYPIRCMKDTHLVDPLGFVPRLLKAGRNHGIHSTSPPAGDTGVDDVNVV